MKSHYVPRLILRKFAKDEKISVYDIERGELMEGVSVAKAYSEEDYYDDETERELNLKVESQFGNFLSNRLLKSSGTVALTKTELLLIKKFLVISVLRVYKPELVELEMKQNRLAAFCFPFEERRINGEGTREYWLRSLSVILDSDGTPKDVAKNPDATYYAYRWAQVIEAGFLGFWDAPVGGEFVITDVGMTSENEKAWSLCGGNIMKRRFALESTGLNESAGRVFRAMDNFHENFMMFPISAHRMIVLLSPFFKLRYYMRQDYHKVPDLKDITYLPREELYLPNRVEEGTYIYEIKQLKGSELKYCNALFMDRICTHLGFCSLEAVKDGILLYKSVPVQRNNYLPLYEQLRKRGLDK